MSHLDEGQLHAHLDGATARDGEGRREIEAHVAGCAQCRARLDEERRVRDRAGAILRAGGPGDVAAPPFEQIAERKRRVRPRRVPHTMVLAWAATIALALGVGWYARSLGLPEIPAAVDLAVEPPATQPAPQIALEAAPPAAAPATRRDAAPARERTAAPAEGQPQLADRLTAAPVPGRDSASAAEADMRQNTRDLAALAIERAAPTVAADEPEVWVPVNRAEAERRLDAQLAALPELETLDIMVREGTGVPLVRTVQRLPDGRTIELLQERMPEEKREDRAAAQVPANAVTVEWRNSRVTARGPLPPDSLRALLRRLGRAQPPEPDQLRDD